MLHLPKLIWKPGSNDSGICTAVPRELVRATGGDRAGDSCTFPFDYENYTFNSCVESNVVSSNVVSSNERNRGISFLLIENPS